MEEQRKAPLTQQALCGDCTTLLAAFWCPLCELYLCETCDASSHRVGASARHVRERLVQSEPEQSVPQPDPQLSSNTETHTTRGFRKKGDKSLQELVHVGADLKVHLTRRNFYGLLDASRNTVHTPAVYFIGATHSGKSFLIRGLLEALQPELSSQIQTAEGKDLQPTTSDIHMWQIRSPLANMRILDVEGDSGAGLPKGMPCGRIPDFLTGENMDNFIDQRRKVVRKDFPRLAYVTGDLVVYVSERSFAHTGYLEELQQFVAASISNVVVGSMKPALILVRNKTSALDAEMDVEACTKDFATCHNCEAEMNERFSAWKCIAVPYADTKEFPEQMKRFTQLINEVLKKRQMKARENHCLLSENQWCLLLSHSVKGIRKQRDLVLDRMQARVQNFSQPLAKTIWLMLSQYTHKIASQEDYLFLAKAAVQVLVALVLERSRSEGQEHQEGVSIDDDVVLTYARLVWKELGERYEDFAPCAAVHPTLETRQQHSIPCALTRRSHGDPVHVSACVAAPVAKTDGFWRKLRKFVFKASFTESWPGAFDMIPLFKDTMEAELLECYSRCKGDEKVIHSLKYSALYKCVTRFRPEKLEHPHMMCLLCLQRRADAQFQPCGCIVFCTHCTARCLMQKTDKCPRSALRLDMDHCPRCKRTFNDFKSHDRLVEVPLLSFQQTRIGRGAFSKVFKAGDMQTKETVAVKVMFLHDQQSQDKFWREAECLHALRHENIVAFKGWWKDPRNSDRLGLVMEYVAMGDLRNLIRNGDFAEGWWGKYLKMAEQVDKALAYIHARKIIHADIKLSNILVTQDWDFKVADFGIARLEEVPGVRARRKEDKILGTVQYMAPEVFKDGPTTASDIFSYGVLLYEAAHGMERWEELEASQIIENTLRFKHPPIDKGCCSSLLEDLISRCWDFQIKQRPTAFEILQSISEIRDGPKPVSKHGSQMSQEACATKAYNPVKFNVHDCTMTRYVTRQDSPAPSPPTDHPLIIYEPVDLVVEPAVVSSGTKEKVSVKEKAQMFMKRNW